MRGEGPQQVNVGTATLGGRTECNETTTKEKKMPKKLNLTFASSIKTNLELFIS